MWGGWFADSVLMNEIAEMKKIYDTGLTSNEDMLSAEVVFFADEESYANVFSGSPQISGIFGSRIAIGKSGVPYDTCAVGDAKEILGKYKAAIFPFPIPSESGERAMKLCEEMGIPYIRATAEHPTLDLDEIRKFLEGSGVNLYAPMGEVVYAGCGYIGLHSSVGGKKELKLPRKMKVSAVFGAEYKEQVADRILFELPENATALFKIDTDCHI
jgi:beta-galactosidase